MNVKQCETCGNEYDHCMTITFGEQNHNFDCFECAIHAMAPRCEYCAVRIIGHGVQSKGNIYCSANCVRNAQKAA